MKKLFLSIIYVVAGISSLQAQMGVHARIEAGVSLSQVRASLIHVDISSLSSMGYRVGATLEIPIAPFIYLAPNISFRAHNTQYGEVHSEVFKGSLDNVEDLQKGLNSLNTSNRASYLLIPLNLGIKLGTRGLGILVEFGPYAGYAVEGDAFSLDLFKQVGLDFNRISYGVGASVALRIHKVYLRGGYEHELSDKFILRQTAVNLRAFQFNDRGFYVILGYRF